MTEGGPYRIDSFLWIEKAVGHDLTVQLVVRKFHHLGTNLSDAKTHADLRLLRRTHDILTTQGCNLRSVMRLHLKRDSLN
mmetsp:Transcript_10439/g.34847  ORF Transcript_10439/g.34847 Transcript_10439/m.34847 type:complete len:80 (-) Transcript_10439:523-762(-)